MATILGETKFFLKLGYYCADIPCGPKILSKLLYLFSRYKRFFFFFCFPIFAKNLKIQNGRHFWRDKIFLKIVMPTLQEYLVGQNFVEIALSSTVFEI